MVASVSAASWAGFAVSLFIVVVSLGAAGVFGTDTFKRGGSPVPKCSGCGKGAIKPGCPVHDPQVRRSAA